MNPQGVVTGVCVVGAVLVGGGFLKKNIDTAATQKEYTKEIETYNKISSTEHGSAEGALVRAGQLKTSLDPEKAKKIYDLKMKAVSVKTNEEQIKFYHEIIQLDPEDDDALGLLANRLVNLGRYSEAKKCYEKIIETSKVESRVKVAKRELSKLNEQRGS